MSLSEGGLVTGLNLLALISLVFGPCTGGLAELSELGFGAANSTVRLNVRYVPITFGVPRSSLSLIVEENLRSSEYGLHQFEIGELTSNAIASGHDSMGNSCFFIAKILTVKSKRKKILCKAIVVIPLVRRFTFRLLICSPTV